MFYLYNKWYCGINKKNKCSNTAVFVLFVLYDNKLKVFNKTRTPVEVVVEKFYLFQVKRLNKNVPNNNFETYIMLIKFSFLRKCAQSYNNSRLEFYFNFIILIHKSIIQTVYVGSLQALKVCRFFHQKSNNVSMVIDMQPPEQIGFTGCSTWQNKCFTKKMK
jgi:hypothetical protein